MKKITLLMLSLILSCGMMAQLQVMSPSASKAYNYAQTDGVLYSQMTPGTNSSPASQQFPDFGDCRLQSADDFIVPPGAGWDIDLVEVLGTYSAFGPADSFIVEIYADNSGLPANTPLYSQTGLAYTEANPLFTIPLSSTISLPPGHYWISVMADMNFTVTGQWYWVDNQLPLNNNQMAFQDPCGIIGGFPTWAQGSNVFGDSFDVCFALHSAPPPPPIPLSNWAIIIGVLLMGVFIVIRFKTRLA